MTPQTQRPRVARPMRAAGRGLAKIAETALFLVGMAGAAILAGFLASI